MVYKKEMNIKQRITALTSLLSDSKLLGFNPVLVIRYNNQLVSLLVSEAEYKRKVKGLGGQIRNS